MRILTGPSLAILLAFGLTTPPANAVPVDFSESVSGDLVHPLHPNNSIDFDSFTLFNADIGTNVLSGHHSENSNPYFFDYDSFRLVVPDTMDLTAVFLEVSNVQSTGNVTSYDGAIYLWQDSNIFDVDDYCLIANGGSSCSSLTSFPLELWRMGPGSVPNPAFGNGVFDIMLALSGSSGNASGYTVDYDWRLSFLVEERVATVPEPATLGLLGFALAALGLVGRRRRSAARRKATRRTIG